MVEEFQAREKITERDIILEYIRSIGQKFLVEFKGGYWVEVDHGNWMEKKYIPDSRKEAIQSIEFLSDLLLPKFDAQMQRDYDEIMKEVDKLLSDFEGEKIDHERYIILKMRLMRRLFQKLNLLLQRTQYLQRKAVAG